MNKKTPTSRLNFKIFWIAVYLGIISNYSVTHLSRTKQGEIALSNSLRQRSNFDGELRPVSCPLRYSEYANTKKETYSDLSCAWNQGKRMGRREDMAMFMAPQRSHKKPGQSK